MRFKNRYLICRLVTESKRHDAEQAVQPRDFYNAIQASLLTQYGEWGLGQALPGTYVSFYDDATGIAVVRTACSSVGMVQTSLAFVTTLKRSSITVHVIRIAGSMRTCRGAALGAVRAVYAERQLEPASISAAELEQIMGGHAKHFASIGI